MIGKLLAPYEAYLWAALVLVVMIGSVVLVHRIEVIGENKVKAADAKVAQAQLVHKEEVEKRAQELNAEAAATLKTAIAAPATSTVVVRVCPQPPTARLGVPTDGAPGTASAGGQPSSSAVGAGSTGAGVDIAPETERLLKECDAKVAYWKSYYQNCVKMGACQPAPTP